MNDKPYYLLLKSYHTMATNPLNDRIGYLKAKFQAAKDVGITSSSGAVIGSGNTPVPIVRRISILATPYALGKSGKSITGDSIPFYGGDSSFDVGANGGILGAVINRLGPLGVRQFPTFKQETKPATSPASSGTSGNTVFYGAVNEPTDSQKLNNYLSG